MQSAWCWLKITAITRHFNIRRNSSEAASEVAPLMMPLGNSIYQFPELSRRTFYGLPGLLADSLPDKFGNAVINTWLEKQGRPLGSVDAIERLLN